MSPRKIFPAKKRLTYPPPGWGLRRFADFWFSKRTFATVFGPMIDEMQQEHLDALIEGRLWKARVVLLRGCWAFWAKVVALLPISFARSIYKIWKKGD